jgi:hypothetical protein
MKSNQTSRKRHTTSVNGEVESYKGNVKYNPYHHQIGFCSMERSIHVLSVGCFFIKQSKTPSQPPFQIGISILGIGRRFAFLFFLISLLSFC